MTIRRIALTIAGSILVGVTYLAGLMAAGLALTAIGFNFGSTSGSAEMLPWMFLGGVVVGLVLGPIASQLTVSRLRHLFIWTFVIFFNLASVLIEGAFFAPQRIGANPIPLVVQQLIASILTAGMVTLLFAHGSATRVITATRAWYSWIWRFLASGVSYLVFYFVFGGINYTFVTKPYYDSHAGGLTVPAPGTVLVAELIRGMMIALSVVPFLLVPKPLRVRAILTGVVLFAVGGIMPLLFQVGSLPVLLLAASGIEILCQNFSTGVVAALILGTQLPNMPATTTRSISEAS